jgi:hypothetical protein
MEEENYYPEGGNTGVATFGGFFGSSEEAINYRNGL